MSREVCLSLLQNLHYLTVLGTLPWLFDSRVLGPSLWLCDPTVLGSLRDLSVVLSMPVPYKAAHLPHPKPGMGSLLGPFSIEQDAFRTAWAPNSFLFQGCLTSEAQEETNMNCHQCQSDKPDATSASRMAGEVNLSHCKQGQIPHSLKQRKKGTAKAQSLQHIIFHLPAVHTAPVGVHRHRQTTKQLVFAVAATNWTDMVQSPPELSNIVSTILW